MSADLAYEIKDCESRGKCVIAKKDLLPGEAVMEEEPIVRYSRIFLEQFKDSKEVHYSKAMSLATFHIFMTELTNQQKTTLLSLYGPTTGKTSRDLFEHASQNVKYQMRSLTAKEVRLYVKIARVVQMNMLNNSENYAIYKDVSRVTHSCFPNCQHDMGTRLYATRPIQAGEEITMSYVPCLDNCFTHMRRSAYLDSKEFTCHCPRCVAVGDNHRKFDCFDPTCNGVMMVCQPISKDVVKCGLRYEGVEYVEPHLLPCTVCHHTAPPSYQTEMLALEDTLGDTVDSSEARLRALPAEVTIFAVPLLAEKLHRLKAPHRHMCSAPLLSHRLYVFLLQGSRSIACHELEKAKVWLGRARETALQFVALLEGVLSYAHDWVRMALQQVIQQCLVHWNTLDPPLSIFPPLEAKEILQKTLRMHFVREGRERRDAELEDELASALQKIKPPPLVSMQLCAFCEESPLRAALTLSRCGRCRQVCYCSAGCQKAHWKLHKKVCKTASQQ